MRGHIRPRGTTLEVRVYAGRVDGKPRYITRTVRDQGTPKATRAAAERELTKLLAEVDAGAHTGPDATFTTLAERWWSTHVADWSPSTASGYRFYLDGRILPALGGKRITKITVAELDATYGAWRAAGASPATIRKAHNLIGRIYRQAQRWGWVTRNPADDASPPKLNRTRITPPDPEQVRQLIEATDPEFALFLRLAAVTGARRGELCGLRWRDVDHSTIRITTSYVRGIDGHHDRGRTKSDRDRIVDVDERTAALLREHRKRCAERALITKRSLRADAYVFSPEPDGKRPFRPNSVSQRFARLTKRLGLDCRLHDLRHYVATRLIADGVPIPDVAAVLGHASPAVTAAIYAHSIAENRQRAAKVMGRLVG